MIDKEKRYFDINPKAVLIFFLTKWYAVFATAIILAIISIVIGIWCRRLISEDGNFDPALVTEIVTEEQANVVRGLLSEDSMQEINICMDCVERMQESKQYMNEAVLMKIDPYDCKRLIIIYEASSEILAAAMNCTAQYTSFVNTDEGLIDAISHAIGDDEGKYHISDLITTNEEPPISQGTINIVRLNVNIVVLDEWDEKAIVDAVRMVIESHNVKEISEDATVEFSFYKSSAIKKSYAGVQDLQTRVINQYNTDSASLLAVSKSLDRNTALLYNYELYLQGVEDDYKVTVAEPKAEDLLEIEKKAGIRAKIAGMSSFKLVLFGSAGGVFLYCGTLMGLFVVRGRAGRVLGISVMSDRPLFGIVNERRVNKEKDKKNVDLTVANLSFYLTRMGEKKVDIICIGKNGAECKTLMELIGEKIRKRDKIESKVFCVDLDDPNSYVRLNELGKVAVVCIAFEKNTIKEIYTLESKLALVGINLVGSIGVE